MTSKLKALGGCSSPSSRPRARRWRTTNVCDAWPVRRQTYSYLPSCKASLPIGWYRQIILLGDRGTCVLTTCPGLHLTAGRLGFETMTYRSQVRHSTASALSHTPVWFRGILCLTYCLTYLLCREGGLWWGENFWLC